jgi:predicted glutamine amidotransferase
MCGIGGFSLTAESKVNPRVLSNALLTALEDRGYMASGFAWQNSESSGYFKAPVPGSSLKLKSMPKDAKTVIVHTRLATHGSIDDNRNNHPVTSPMTEIALVHNGVIYNHATVRESLPDIDFAVDTAVIPALIEADPSLERLRELDGDAAIAWLNYNHVGELNVARLEHSPLVICQLEDGSFIFASTEALLWRVLVQLDLMPEFIKNVAEYTYMQVKNGVITTWEDLKPSIAVRQTYDYSGYRHLTSGAKSTANPWWEEADPYDDYSGIPRNKSYPYSYSYDWDDDDDDENEAEIREWNAQFIGSPPAPQNIVTPATDDENDMYYLEYRSDFAQKTRFMWYHLSEHESWREDIFLLSGEHNDYDLVDYGIVDSDGMLSSEMPKGA